MTKIWVLILVYLTPSQHFSEVKLYAMPDELTCRRVAAGSGYPGASIKTCQEIEAPLKP
jgi:hypothetical protein